MKEEEETVQEGMEEAPPVTELQDFELPTEPGFTDRVRRSIHRREAASGFVDLSIRGFLQVLLEYLSTLFEAVFPPSDRKDEDKES